MIKKVESLPASRRAFRNEKSKSVCEDIKTFVDEGYQFCEITNPGYEKPNSFYAVAYYYVKKLGFDVNVARRGDRIFLIRGDCK